MELQNLLVQILDGSKKPTRLPLETLRKITDEFSIDRIIGEGGFATVYKGVVGNINIAVKRIRSSKTIDDKLFHREVGSQMEVNHQNIVRFLGLCSETVGEPMKIPKSEKYICVEIRERLLCFEYISNGSLKNKITDELRGLEWDKRYKIIKGICAGLHYLHMEKHILHMDLKPANILLDNQMVPKITDFGLSRPTENSQTTSTKLYSSLGYGAPENMFGPSRMSVKSDMYSLGAIIIELVTGRKDVPDKASILRRWRHRWNKSLKETPLEYHHQVTECIELGSLCLNHDAYARPSISQVMSKLGEMESTKVNPFNWKDDMLGVEPLELQLAYNKKKQIYSCSVELRNDTDDFIAFKIQKNSPLPYSVEPNMDIVIPRYKCTVRVTLPAANVHDYKDSISNNQDRNVFTVESIKLNHGHPTKNINQDMFDKHRAGDNVDVVDLDVAFSSKEGLAEEVIDCPSKQAKKQYASSDDSSVHPGTMQYNVNDQEATIVASSSGRVIKHRRVQLVVKDNKKAPLLEYNKKVMLELTGGDCTRDRPGLDLVAILNVSSSMHGEKMDQLKTAMRFVVWKLCPIDRLSIVTFSYSATKLCPPLQITEASQRKLQELIDGLNAFGDRTNIKAGLLMGLKVLADRKVSDGRVAAIMLMSSDLVDIGKAAEVAVGNIPVYTFSFGNIPVYTFGFDQLREYSVLNAIAANSMGGTFSHIQHQYIGSGGLTMAFSQCLAGLLTVSVQDLELTVTAVGNESRIVKVTAGSYPQTLEKGANGLGGSLTVRFGSLYSSEVRRVIVDLLLPAVGSQGNADILEVTYSYRSSSSGSWQHFVALPQTLTLWRTGVDLLDPDPKEEKPVELQREEARLRTAKLIEEVCNIARYHHPRRIGKLVEAQNMLLEQPNSDRLLGTELQELLELSGQQPSYPSQWMGLYYALSSASSHGRQRFAARGDMQIMRLFATPHMDMYLQEAKKFLDDPAILLLSSVEEVSVASREQEMRRLSLEMED